MERVKTELPSGEHLLQLLGKLAGGAGVLTFLSCLAGIAKLVAMYSWLGCVWVLKLHGFNDFVFEGLSTIAVFSGAAAIAYCMSGNHKKILINVSNRLSVLMYVVLFSLVLLGAGQQVLSQYAYHYFFAGAGVNLAGFLSWTMAKRESFVLAFLSFIGFALGAFLLSLMTFYWFDDFYDSHSVVLSNSKLNTRGVLVNSFSGKHLLRVCEPGVRFMVIEPSEDWVSETKGSQFCFGT